MKVKKFIEFINEAEGLSFLKQFPALLGALTDPFTINISPQIKDFSKADLAEEGTWKDAYVKIFQKACKKFGDAKSGDIQKTCNKGKALKGIVSHYIDPQKGVLNSKKVDRFVKDATEGKGPEKGTSYGIDLTAIDEYYEIISKMLLRTGLTPADLKDTGTYALNICIPIMLKFFMPDELIKMKMLTDGKLIEASKAKELIEAGANGGDVNLS